MGPIGRAVGTFINAFKPMPLRTLATMSTIRALPAPTNPFFATERPRCVTARSIKDRVAYYQDTPTTAEFLKRHPGNERKTPYEALTTKQQIAFMNRGPRRGYS